MNEQYMPTTGDIRRWVEYRGPGEGVVFDRWVAAHDRKVKAEALREAIRTYPARGAVPRWFLNGLADEIESEARP